MAEKKKKKENTEFGVADGIAHMMSKCKSAALVSQASNAFADAVYLDFVDPNTGTPCLPLEWMFGTRGLICGRLLNMVAREAVGKTSIVMLLVGMFQKTSDSYTIYAETEETPLPPDRIEELGADPRKILLNDPTSMKDCMKNMVEIGRDIRNEIDPEMMHPIVNIIDSVSGLSEKEMDRSTGEEEGNDGAAQHAREFSKFFRQTLDYFKHSNTVLITTSQEKDAIGTGFGFTNESSYLAAAPIRYHSSWNVDLTNITDKKIITDFEFQQCVRMRMTKNKLARKGRTIDIIMYRDDRGWDFTKANRDLLFGSYSPFEPGTYSSGGNGYYKHDRIQSGTGKSLPLEEFIAKFYADEELLNQCREKLRIRGFGFGFESQFFSREDSEAEEK